MPSAPRRPARPPATAAKPSPARRRAWLVGVGGACCGRAGRNARDWGLRRRAKTNSFPPSIHSISVTFHDDKDGSSTTVAVPIGTNLLEAAHGARVDLEGACEGSLACSTCHVIVEDPALYAAMPEPDDDENDMLDLAFGLTETSRLGCQVVAKKELDGLAVRIPGATRNFAVDGHVPKPH